MKHIFVRYGGVNRKTQKGYNPHNGTFHTPPATKGIYAFPLKAQELFLIGGRFDGVDFEEKKKQKKVFKVAPSTLIWHHLSSHCKPSTIIDRKHSWVKTTVGDWYKAYKKESLNNRYGGNEPYCKTNNINEPVRSGLSGIFSKDHYEVFFEEKILENSKK